MLKIPASCFQISQIVAHTKFIDIHYGPHSGRLRQLDFRLMHYNLHIRRDGHAIVWQKLHRY